MPAPQRTLTVDLVAALRGRARCSGHPPMPTAWVSSWSGSPARVGATAACPIAEATELIDRLSPLPAGSRLTLEPGGQLELSSAPFRTIDDVCTAAAADLAVLDQACEACRRRADRTGRRPGAPARAGGGGAALPGHGALLRPPGPGRAHDDVQHGRHPGQRRAGPPRPDDASGGGWPTSSGRRSSPASPTRRSPAACPAGGSRAGCGPGGRSTRAARRRWPATPTPSRPGRATPSTPGSCWSTPPTARASCPMIEPLRFGDWLADGHELGWPTARGPRATT